MAAGDGRGRKVVHVDMDAFYASVEQRDRPELRGLPVAVGGSPEGRGVVAAASYEARRFGVHSAMPSRTAVRLCPELRFVRPDFAKYSTVSKQLRAIFSDYTALIEPISLDEAFLDVTVNLRGLPSATEVAQEIRQRVRDELGLTCSAGVGPNKLVAKIASAHRKPDGLTVVPPHRVRAFLDPLPVRKLWGVGPATAKILEELGARRNGDLARMDPKLLEQRLGSRGPSLVRLARGDDPRPVSPHRDRKSRGSEQTFAEDVRDLAVLRRVMAEQAAEICDGLRREGLTGRTVTVKVRYSDFTTVSRSTSLERGTRRPEEVLALAEMLLGRTDAGTRPVRLVGVSLSNLESPEELRQLELPWP